ncbi:TIGR02680 family protein [Enterocloster lavalensis]|uniref:TIGR02680 family protein n=1 Tax=Enterocloster lavalensis TaxID=460384 RepID=UPI0034A59649
MNRIGFVNFWLYDEEDFEFEDGKLLLRRQNASGKSITPQSFIPFILDGDRTPSRLDPFGSSDRRMEYYFLGEEGKEEYTGYLFLEFKKEQSEEYRTIAIGQRAKKGKPMDFWGFVILDGRRIGYDLKLYKEIGSSKIPYDRREMKTELGEENFFTTSQSEYKKAVNQYIFGFRKAEQYEQFIKLLVKVRAPKLSKEFKPTKVYEILNDSLQTLTDEDLRAMVDAMEKMDEIQESLELLKRAFDDVKIIRNEYTRYNQYMLAKKAQAYMAMKQKVETEQCQLTIQEQKRQETEEARNSKSQLLADLEEQKKLKEIERVGLLDADLEGIDRKLEQARREKEEAAKKVTDWEKKTRDYQEMIYQGEQRAKEIEAHLDQIQQEIGEAKSELGEQQEILQWEQHEAALQMIDRGEYEKSGEIVKGLDSLRKQLAECKREICEYEELSRQYDELAAQLERLGNEKAENEQRLKTAREEVVRCEDQWIEDIYDAMRKSSQWRPDSGMLPKLEEKIREYQSAADAETVQALLRTDYERQRQGLMDLKNSLEYQKNSRTKELDQEKEKLTALENSGELEPERDENIETSRKALEEAGIKAVPFYKTVEFSEHLDERDCARLEAQLQKMGILDALVVSTDEFDNIRKPCPGFLDTVLYVKEDGGSGFSKLTVSEELEPALKETVWRILGNIYEDKDGRQGIHLGTDERRGIYLGKDGSFKQGILAGKAGKAGSAEFVGVLARKRRKEQRIRELEDRISEITEIIESLEQEITTVKGHLEKLQEEYQKLPGFSEINAALDQEKECEYKLQKTCEEYGKKEAGELQLRLKKSQQYQTVLQKCKPFPYGRTEDAYVEANDALEEYSRVWQEIRHALLQLKTAKENLRAEKDRIVQNEQSMDDAFAEKRSWSTKEKESEIQIRQFEEYLSRPEIAKKAERLKQLKNELDEIGAERDALKKDLIILEERLRGILEEEPKQKESLRQKIVVETCLRNYFEEELALNLVFARESQGIFECAKRAVSVLREGDKNREPTDLLQALHQVYQRHNGSLVGYGTSLEECFDTPVEAALETEAAGAIRKRVRIVSSWNGKRVYLEEFYGILKQGIDETELLIQKKDRELFEDILSQTISRQLTDRIAESRKWVSDMSQLMREMDTSMGLIFSLDWKPCKAENDMELDTAELEQILLRDHTLLTIEDIEKVAAHFRSRIRMEKLKLEEKGDMINYMDLVRDALDYRKWFEFHMYFRRGEGERKLLTNAAFNRFSGGEKAMAMYVPLFAAVNAQYKKAEQEDHPRIIALDEAFAGVDDKNISSMFELVHKLDFDYIMNSQALWGCFETVKGLRIAELLRPQDSQIVSVILYTWNGREKILDVQ